MILKVVTTGGCNSVELMIGRLEIYGDEIADHFFVYLTFGRVCSRSAKSKRVCFCPRLLAYFALTISYDLDNENQRKSILELLMHRLQL